MVASCGRRPRDAAKLVLGGEGRKAKSEEWRAKKQESNTANDAELVQGITSINVEVF
jgi:hypothetical protein